MKEKYTLVIIVALGFLLLCKSCQSCTRQRALEYVKTEHVQYVDSVSSVIREMDSKIVTADDSIKILNTKIDALLEAKGLMQSSLDHAVSTNQSLVQTIKNNSNKK
jgi:hypothetical protein